jgi:subtilisin family serine protease
MKFSLHAPRLAVTAVALLAAACADPAGPDAATPAPTDTPAFARAPGGDAGQPIADEYIVVFRDDVADPEVKAKDKERKLKSGKSLKHVYKAALKGFAAELTPEDVAALRADPDVAYVEQDQEVFASTTQSGATWGLDRIDARAGLSGTFSYTSTGANVNAYIIDTGIRGTHTEFTGRVRAGFTAINDRNGTTDCNGHGTHVAGTVGGTTYGVAKRVTLYPVRVLNCRGSGTNSGVIAGIDWVADRHVKPAVANMSLGGGASQAINDAVQRAVTKGITMVVAAGNDGANACSYSPASAPNAITVGATTSTDARSSYSNFGSCVDVFAPGSSITSAWYRSDTQTNTISGTSMASPHVAGVAALYLQGSPGATPSAVAAAIKGGATTGAVTSAGSGSPNLLLYTAY